MGKEPYSKKKADRSNFSCFAARQIKLSSLSEIHLVVAIHWMPHNFKTCYHGSDQHSLITAKGSGLV